MNQGRQTPTKRGPYVAKNYSKDVKDVIGSASLGLQQRGSSSGEIVKFWKESGYPVPERSLRRWMQKRARDEPVESAEKKSGRKKLLTELQQMIAAGWVLQEPDPVSLRRYQQQVRTMFGRGLGSSVAWNYMEAMDLTCQLMGSRALPPNVTQDDVITEGYEFVLGLHNSAWLQFDMSKLASIDFMSTAVKKDRATTFAAKNGRQKKLRSIQHQCTGNILTVAFADGVVRIPYTLFASDPALKKGSETRALLLAKYPTVRDSQIVHFDGENWVGEKAWMVQTVLEKYPSQWRGARVLCDKGGAYRQNGESIFEDTGVESHAVYPPNPHGFLSPNDNFLHSAARNIFRPRRKPAMSDAEIMILYLDCLAQVKPKTIRAFWNHNFLMNVSNPTRAEFERRVLKKTKSNPKREALHKRCRREYANWVAKEQQRDE